MLSYLVVHPLQNSTPNLVRQWEGSLTIIVLFSCDILSSKKSNPFVPKDLVCL